MVISRGLWRRFRVSPRLLGRDCTVPTQAEYDKTEKLQSDLAIPDRAKADSLLYRIPETLKFLYQQNSPVITGCPILCTKTGPDSQSTKIYSLLYL